MLHSIPVEFTCTCCKNFLNSILMPVSICTEKEFLIESKLNGFLGVLLLLLDSACHYFRVYSGEFVLVYFDIVKILDDKFETFWWLLKSHHV